ncbi:hypothetical protein E2562_009514 [Oryza meyeriana var. granulata]|uniref:Uncharacterized protein n=1 Tax=Oryza meyeriana var. granulata TaxID=110450 RepID=A0A6G1BTD1_9ORYZ|nr:hypothetical protein E2562_009514 [Oryza meyeriana var. granulata]
MGMGSNGRACWRGFGGGGFGGSNGERLPASFSGNGGADRFLGGVAMMEATTEGHDEALSNDERRLPWHGWSSKLGHGGSGPARSAWCGVGLRRGQVMWRRGGRPWRAASEVALIIDVNDHPVIIPYCYWWGDIGDDNGTEWTLLACTMGLGLLFLLLGMVDINGM